MGTITNIKEALKKSVKLRLTVNPSIFMTLQLQDGDDVQVSYSFFDQQEVININQALEILTIGQRDNRYIVEAA